MKENDYYKRLKEHSFKITPKRKAIIKLLLNNKRYYTIQEIKEKLNPEFDKLGIPTLYRILQQFEKLNMVNSIIVEDNRIAYYLCDWARSNHHHFICKKCKGVFCLEFCAKKQITEAVKDQLNGVFLTHKLNVEGFCSNCMKEKE